MANIHVCLYVQTERRLAGAVSNSGDNEDALLINRHLSRAISTRLVVFRRRSLRVETVFNVQGLMGCSCVARVAPGCEKILGVDGATVWWLRLNVRGLSADRRTCEFFKYLLLSNTTTDIVLENCRYSFNYYFQSLRLNVTFLLFILTNLLLSSDGFRMVGTIWKGLLGVEARIS